MVGFAESSVRFERIYLFLELYPHTTARNPYEPDVSPAIPMDTVRATEATDTLRFPPYIPRGELITTWTYQGESTHNNKSTYSHETIYG